jgi:hypothetical protein
LWSGLELKQPGKRLKSVRTRLALPLSAGFALILSTSWTTTSLAQTTEPDGPIAMEASAGLANYVDGRGPVDLAVTISADVLFAGNLEVRQTASLIMVPVEVPAGGEKTYHLVVPPPTGSTQARLRLYATGSEQAVLSRTLQLRVAQTQTLVAVLGPPEVVAAVDRATVSITEAEVIGTAVTPERLAIGIDPARYLVLSPATAIPQATLDWLRAGGRLVVDEDEVARLGLDLGAPLPEEDSVHYRVGAGTVVAVDDMSGLDSEEWSEVIRPGPMQLSPREAWQSPDLQMMGAATNAGDQRVPRLPWLLGAVVMYALLIGPVNFLVLRRLGKREFAWVTIPVLSVLALAGFWIAGRSQLETTLVNHATVVVGGENATARSAVALAVGAAGQRSVAVPKEWRAYPTSVSSFSGELPAATIPGVLNEDGSYQFELEQLGAVGIQGTWTANELRLPELSASFEGQRLSVNVNNTSDLEFWAWGLVAKGRVAVAAEALASGAQGSESVIPGAQGFNEFGSVGDAVINARQMWDDPVVWQRLSPLGNVAAFDLHTTDTYFFGFSDTLDIPVSLDGGEQVATGVALVVIPIDATATDGDGLTMVSHLVDPGDATWIDFGPGYLHVYSSEVTVGWNVASKVDANPKLMVSNMFGEVPRNLVAFNWLTSRYDEIAVGGIVDLNRYRSVDGAVLVRATADEPNAGEFVELTVSPYAFTLEWTQ